MMAWSPKDVVSNELDALPAGVLKRAETVVIYHWEVHALLAPTTNLSNCKPVGSSRVH